MSIPEGFKLVPVEPTAAMEDAAAPECGGYCPRCDTDVQIKTGMQVDIYRTMVDAAPAPPQPIYDEAKERELARFSYDADSEFTGGWFDYLYGWLACAQSRAKSVEETP